MTSAGLSPFLVCPPKAFGKPTCRLGLASHVGTEITPDDVLYVLDKGVNFLNWAGQADTEASTDAFSEAISTLGPRREEVVVCVQFGARTAADAADELRSLLETLHTDYIDVLTCYYVERVEEWQQLTASRGVLEYCRSAQREGRVRLIGVTSHQRPLAAEMARTGLLDVLMIRYNAAHRGAEREIFPVTDALGMQVIAYTAQRWGALSRPTPSDPPGFVVPAAPDWYRFVLRSPSVGVVLMAPHTRAELEQDLTVLHQGPLDEAEVARLREHGDRVRKHAGTFW